MSNSFCLFLVFFKQHAYFTFIIVKTAFLIFVKTLDHGKKELFNDCYAVECRLGLWKIAHQSLLNSFVKKNVIWIVIFIESRSWKRDLVYLLLKGFQRYLQYLLVNFARKPLLSWTIFIYLLVTELRRYLWDKLHKNYTTAISTMIYQHISNATYQ